MASRQLKMHNTEKSGLKDPEFKSLKSVCDWKYRNFRKILEKMKHFQF